MDCSKRRARCFTTASASNIAHPGRTPPSRRSHATAELMNVTHLECSLTGERYEAGQVHNLSRAGKPLLVRYDMDAAQRTLTRESIATREAGMWKWRELLPHDGEPVSLGEPETPIVALPKTAHAKARPRCW